MGCRTHRTRGRCPTQTPGHGFTAAGDHAPAGYPVLGFTNNRDHGAADLADCRPAGRSGHEQGPAGRRCRAAHGRAGQFLSQFCSLSPNRPAWNSAREKGLPFHRGRRGRQWVQHGLYFAVRGPTVLLPGGTKPGFLRGWKGHPGVLSPRPGGSRRALTPAPLPGPQSREASCGAEHGVTSLEGTGGLGHVTAQSAHGTGRQLSGLSSRQINRSVVVSFHSSTFRNKSTPVSGSGAGRGETSLKVPLGTGVRSARHPPGVTRGGRDGVRPCMQFPCRWVCQVAELKRAAGRDGRLRVAKAPACAQASTRTHTRAHVHTLGISVAPAGRASAPRPPSPVPRHRPRGGALTRPTGRGRRRSQRRTSGRRARCRASPARSSRGAGRARAGPRS